MTIIHVNINTKVANKNLFRYKIDPNSSHESQLPGNHKQYSCLLLEDYISCIDIIQSFKVRADDIWIVGLPKSGTTWMHNIVYKLIYGLDHNSIADKLESQYFDKCARDTIGSMKCFDELPSPRIFKTHLPAFLLPKEFWIVKPKIIYTARNPKDSAISSYHMLRNSIYPSKETLDDHCKSYLNESNYCAPFFDHVRGFLQIKHLDNIFFSVYENLLAFQFQEIKSINDFLGCSFTDNQLLQLMENVSFKNMREEFPSFISPKDKTTMPDPNFRFCRKGKAGTFREEMGDDLIQKFDEWTAERLADSNFQFPVYKIDPNSSHESQLPGNHKQYSCLLPEEYIHCIDKIQSFKVRADDIWIVGLPKSGTTWMHNIVYKLNYGLDHDSIADKLESQYFDKCASSTKGPMKCFDEIQSPRIFKTHLPAFLLPKELWIVKPKIIYTARNPKDLAVSSYHMLRNSIFSTKATLDDYCTSYLNEINYCAPFFDHVGGFLQIKNLDNIFFSIYENLLTFQFQGIKSINDFLGCSFTDDQLSQLMENVSFKNMREEFPSFISPTDTTAMADPNYRFCRKGKAGTFREEMSNDLIQKFDDWTAKRLAGTNFQFPV